MHKKYIRLQLRIYLLLFLVYFIVSLVSGLLFYFVLPQKYYGIFPGIGIFFCLAGLLLNWRLNRVRSTTPDKLISVFMIGRMWKFLATLLFLFGYVILDGQDKISFGISLMLNYILYSSLEIYILYLYQKRLIKHGKKNKK